MLRTIVASTVSLQYQNTSYKSEEEQQQLPVIKTTRDVSTDVKVSVGVGTGKCHWYFAAKTEAASRKSLAIRVFLIHSKYFAVSDWPTIFARCEQYSIFDWKRGCLSKLKNAFTARRRRNS